MSKIVFTLTGVRNVTEMIKRVGLIASMADILIYVPDRCSASLRAALSAKAQINVLLPNLKFSVSQDVTDVEKADMIIISGFVAPSKTIQQFLPLAERTMTTLFDKLNLKEDVKIVFNGGVRGLICAYFVKQLKKVPAENLTVFKPFFIPGTKTFGNTAESVCVYPTLIDFELYRSTADNTSQLDRLKFVALKKFPLALETIEAEILGETVQCLETNIEMMLMRGKFPNEDEQKYFDIDDEFPVFIPGDGVVDDATCTELKNPVKRLWTELRQVILDYVTKKILES